MVLAEVVLETEGESDEASVTVPESQQRGPEVILRIAHVGRSQGSKPLF